MNSPGARRTRSGARFRSSLSMVPVLTLGVSVSARPGGPKEFALLADHASAKLHVVHGLLNSYAGVTRLS